MKRILGTMVLAMTLVTSADAQWRETTGPEGGSFHTIATTGDELLASTWQGRIYRWQLNGPWRQVSSLPHPTLISAGGNYLAISSDTLFRSSDHGDTWVATAQTGSSMNHTVDEGAIYVANGGTIVRSDDGGATWEPVGAPENIWIGAIWAHGANMIVTAAGGSDVYRSTDRGATWSDARDGLPAGIAPFEFYSDGPDVYMSMPTSGVFRSTDAGATWTGLNEGLPNYEGSYPTMTDMVISNGVILGSMQSSVYRFDGSRWSLLDDEKNVVFERRGDVVYKASSAGPARSEDGGATWMSLAGELRAVDITALARVGETVIAGSSTGIYTSSDGGYRWTKSIGSSADEFVTVGSTILARGWRIAREEQVTGPGLLQSTDDGKTWWNSGSGISEDLDHISAIASNGTTLFAGFNETFGFHGVSHWQAGGIFRSTDQGLSWSATSSGLPSDGFSLVPIIDIVATDKAVVATTLAGVYRSSNNGSTWTKVTAAPAYDAGIGVMVASGSTIDLAVGRMIYRSTDDGATWTPIETGFEEYTHIYNLQVIGGDLIAFTNQQTGSDQVFVYDGESWERLNDEFPPGVTFRTFLPVGEQWLGGSSAMSVWNRRARGTSPVVARGDAAGAATVEPNPFGSSATIAFTLPARSFVRLEIIDLTGRSLYTAQSGIVDAGRQRIALDGAGLAPGRYFYRLSVNGTTTSGTVVRTGE